MCRALQWIEKLNLRIELAKDEDSRDHAYANLERQQALVHLEMLQVHSEMVRLKVKLAKARLDHTRAVLDNAKG